MRKKIQLPIPPDQAKMLGDIFQTFRVMYGKSKPKPKPTAKRKKPKK